MGLVALRRGDLARAISVLEPAAGPSRGADRPAWFPLMAAALGTTYTVAGRIDDARSLLAQALEQTEATDVAVNQALCNLALGGAQLAADRVDEAQSLADRALSLAVARGERGVEAHARYLLGDLSMRRRPRTHAAADAHYRQALTVANEVGMKPLQAHCHRALGALYSRTERRRQARSELATAVRKYRAMGMAFWLPQAEAMLARAN